jgi:GNAT superfamily N-acetyltransferase
MTAPLDFPTAVASHHDPAALAASHAAQRHAESTFVRAATPADLPAIMDLGRLFFIEGKLPGRLIPEVAADNWAKLIASGAGMIFVLCPDTKVEGALGAIAYHDLNDGAVVAAEMFWYVHPDYRGNGLRLVSAFEQWATEQGAERILIAHMRALMPERLKALYSRRGYSEVETFYFKNLCP